MVFVPLCVPHPIASLGTRRPPRSVCGWSEAGGGYLQVSRRSRWGARCALTGPEGPNRDTSAGDLTLGPPRLQKKGPQWAPDSDGPAWAGPRIPAQRPPQVPSSAARPGSQRERGLYSLPRGEGVVLAPVCPSQTRAASGRPKAPHALALVRLTTSSLPALGEH